jgi:hypothetical protein
MRHRLPNIVIDHPTSVMTTEGRSRPHAQAGNDMPAQFSIDYFLVRENEERIASANSITPTLRDIHLDMAERYADLASMAAELEYDAKKLRRSEGPT